MAQAEYGGAEPLASPNESPKESRQKPPPTCRSDSTRDSEGVFQRVDSPQLDQAGVATPDSLVAYLDKLSVADEAVFRYAHELNKTLFALRVARSVFDYLHGHRICRGLLTLGYLTLCKARLTLKQRLSDIAQRINCFGLQKFAVFLKSPHYERMRGKFQKTAAQARTMQKRVRATRRFDFFVRLWKLDQACVAQASIIKLNSLLNGQLTKLLKSAQQNRGTR